MTAILPQPAFTLSSQDRGKMVGSLFGVAVGVARLPTDPLYYTDLTLENIVVGSRYRVTRKSNGDELALGVASSTTEVINIPVYSSNMQVDITIRNASGTPAYRIFNTVATIYSAGGSAYCLQQLDE